MTTYSATAGETSAGLTLTPDAMRHVKAWIAAAGIEAGPLFRGVLKGVSTRRAPGRRQVMIQFGAELPGVTHAGRWKTPAMVARYTQRLTVRHGAAAQIAAKRKQF